MWEYTYFHILLVLWISYMIYLLIEFTHFSKVLFFLFLLIYRNSLYILWICIFHYVYFKYVLLVFHVLFYFIHEIFYCKSSRKSELFICSFTVFGIYTQFWKTSPNLLQKYFHWISLVWFITFALFHLALGCVEPCVHSQKCFKIFP